MKLLYISGYQFVQKEDGMYSLPAYGNNFWTKYLGAFDSIRVLGVKTKDYLIGGSLVKISDPRIDVSIIPNNVHPSDFKNDGVIKRILDKEIKEAEALLIKPSSRKGIMAIKLAEKYHKPYMVELTGDLKLTLSQHSSLLKRIYSPFLHWQITRTMKNAPFGLYVTERYLQTVYPIKGKMCGITDSVIDSIDKEVLLKRISKIEASSGNIVNIGLIGSYNGNRKGVDTALKALSKINKNYKLNILYNGSKEDRDYWYNYAESLGVKDQLTFPDPRSTTKEVMEWIDTQDVIILPSRSEGLPRCIVESMSRACPCITSNVCGMPELINNKWVHDPEDVQGLADMLVGMIEQKENLLEAAKENFENSKRFLRTTLSEKRDAFLNEFKEYCINHK